MTEEDQQALNDKDKSMNKGQDSELDEKEITNDYAAKDLDIPGRAEDDINSEGTDIPDEENKQFNNRGTKPEYQKNTEHPNSDKKYNLLIEQY